MDGSSLFGCQGTTGSGSDVAIQGDLKPVPESGTGAPFRVLAHIVVLVYA